MKNLIKKSINRAYFHIPFCESKCSYCAFHSVPVLENSIINRFLSKTDKDLEASKDLFGDVSSIYIGGGTPTLLTKGRLLDLFETINKHLTLDRDAEITIEANPESLDPEKIKTISSFVNRVSLGIQSFNPTFREKIGRRGNLKFLENHLHVFRDNGIKNISFDLIYGIPGQSVKDFFLEVEKALDLNLKHISAYSLTLEENSSLNETISQKELLNSDKASATIWKKLPSMLKKYGFKRYEISNYAISGFECKHNLDAWFGGKYIGFGPTASSYDGKQRWTSGKINNWLNNKNVSYDRISSNRRIREILTIGLRSVFPWKIIKNKRTYILSNPINDSLYTLTSREYLELSKTCYHLSSLDLLKIVAINNTLKFHSTEKGRLFWNDLALALIV